jgi:predicted nucleotidyltransferase
VRSLFAFGSVCTDKFSESSDVDLLIDFYPMDYGDYADNYFVVADKMEEIFQRDVDLITEKSLSNPHFIESINRTKVKLYG